MIDLPADQAHYLTNVMRRAIGDEILVFNQAAGEWRAAIDLVAKKACRLRITRQTRPAETPPDLDLLIAVVKRARLETIVEKAAELGCARVRLVITQHTQAEHVRVERLQAIAIEASEQTGRVSVPQVLAPQKLSQVIETWEAGRTLVFCDESGAGRAAADVLARAPSGPAAVLIGPEGGFSADEAAGLRDMPGALVVSLGPRILRADTAAIAALTLWQAAQGDWR